MDSDSIADEDDQNRVRFFSGNEHNINSLCNEGEIFCFNDGHMSELTESSKTDLADLQSNSRMEIVTSSEEISNFSTMIGEGLSQTHNEILADPVVCTL
ncbi:unnamed protein product [Larinioides sclopetarius]|uniref:Uncharacterized protein n=1 Tax=Larinioides sclopetarius TaxID=280406 RepID=A0AAV2BS49_9ARAC